MVTLIAELGSRPAQRVLQALASWTGDVRREVVIDEKRSRGQLLHQDSRFSSSSSSSTSSSSSPPSQRPSQTPDVFDHCAEALNKKIVVNISSTSASVKFRKSHLKKSYSIMTMTITTAGFIIVSAIANCHLHHDHLAPNVLDLGSEARNLPNRISNFSSRQVLHNLMNTSATH